MARTPSNMLALGTKAPDFTLKDLNSNQTLSFSDIRGDKGTVVVFMCNHCPFVIHMIEELVRVENDYHVQGIGFVGINSNDVENYPEDAPENMTKFAAKYKMDFPYLFDETQEVAKAYDAACTPDIYLFDSRDQLVYRGQLDDARPGNHIPLNGADLRIALDALLYNRKYPDPQKPSIGCNIKWKH
ncbi:MAG: thioredoxin family protein [Flavobacteriaceae bacterium]|nr:thioredoxin family protein [Flavobacteriaceae bacterium]